MKKTTSLPIMIISVFLLFLIGALMSEFESDPQDWDVPERFKQMENPVEMDTQSLRIGRSLYRRNCRDCHGSEGKGDGPEAPDLDTEMSDFSSEEVRSQTDGELFYKTREGRDEMPGFKADLYDEDIWHVVNYIRSLQEDQD